FIGPSGRRPRFARSRSGPQVVGHSARPGRFELPTLGSVDQCSIQLSYGRFSGGERLAQHTSAAARVNDVEEALRLRVPTSPSIERIVPGTQSFRTAGLTLTAV